MAKSILGSTSSLLLLGLLLGGCAEQKVNPEKDLTLPEFSFVGLSEPTSDKQNIKLSIHVKIPHTELQFTRSDDNFLARYEVGVTISDENNERIAGNIWSDSLWLDVYKDTRKTDKTVLTMKSFVVPAGELNLSVRVTDLYTNKTRILSKTVDQSQMYSGELALGNIVIMDNRTDQESELLMDQSFFEIVDTLVFMARIMGENHPYKVTYELTAKDKSVAKNSLVLDYSGAIDSLLSFRIPLTDMRYSNYTLHLSAEDGNENHVNTKAHFRVRIRGINFDVGDLDEAVKQLIYIADERQINDILSGNTEDEMIKFNEFWAELDPTPGSNINELMEEYYRRVAFSLEAFTVVQPGWKTDRGMIYILFGPPDEIQRGPFELNQKPYQIWEYYRLGKQFVFRDHTGFGDYRLDQTYLDNNDWRFRY
ncbi:GWxTD domain-containing protein [bacterium]|nr:GWxTD domain-containing protein [bacterium]